MKEKWQSKADADAKPKRRLESIQIQGRRKGHALLVHEEEDGKLDEMLGAKTNSGWRPLASTCRRKENGDLIKEEVEWPMLNPDKESPREKAFSLICDALLSIENVHEVC